MNEVKVIWFVEPLEPGTNATIAEFLTDTEIHRGALCADGKRRDLWDCDYRFIGRLEAATGRLNLKFRVFRRKGGGKIEKWRFTSNRKVRHPAGAT